MCAQLKARQEGGGEPERRDTEDYEDDFTERQMDEMRGLQEESGMGQKKFDPDGPPPPESIDPGYRGVSTDTLRGRGKQGRAAPPVRPHAAAKGGFGAHAVAAAAAGGDTKKRPTGRCTNCDWDTVLIIVLAVVLFSFLILDIYAQIVSRLRGLQPHQHSCAPPMTPGSASASHGDSAHGCLLLLIFRRQKMHSDKQDLADHAKEHDL